MGRKTAAATAAMRKSAEIPDMRASPTTYSRALAQASLSGTDGLDTADVLGPSLSGDWWKYSATRHDAE